MNSAAFIQVGRWNLLALGQGFHPPGLLLLSQSPIQETLPRPSLHLGDTEKQNENTSHQQGLDEAIVELADMAVQVPRLCESAFTPAAGMGLLPRVHHGMPA